MGYHCGVLIFYRWPETTPWARAPVSLFEITIPCLYDKIPFSIPLGFTQGRAAGTTPEDGTACMAYNVSAESEVPQDPLLSMFESRMGESVHTCRFDSQGKPCSAVMWLSGQERVISVETRSLELNDLVDRNLIRIIEALKNMIDLMTPYLTSPTSKKRRQADALQVSRALRAAANSSSSSTALLRNIMPLMSAAYFAERPSMPVLSFSEELLRVEADPRLPKLSPGLGNPYLSLPASMRSVLAELSSEVSEKLKTGIAQCPRTGYLRPQPKKRPARVSKGQGKGQQQARSTGSPQVTKIIMMKDREELTCSLPPASGK